MPHIHTKPGQHDTTASAFIVRVDTPEPRLLLHTHKKLGILLQPGGHVELSENPWQAVVHEIFEESGYETSQLQLLQPRQRIRQLSNGILHPSAICQNTHVFSQQLDHNHSDTSYGFIASEEPAHAPANGESTDLQWFSSQELQALPDASIPANVREIGVFVLNECATHWERVSLTEYQL